MAHPRIEEVSESESDPDDMDPTDFDPTQSIIRPADIPASSQPGQEQLMPQFQQPSAPSVKPQEIKHYHCLYPVYFDATRSRTEGRRVGKELAVENPLARTIVDAVQMLGYKVAFEPGKMHPKDWANPGRVRVLHKENGRLMNPRVKNKHHLYILVSKHLQANPTTQESPLRLRVANMPLPDKPIPPPAAPRGWKMGQILPLHSPALSGGGVSENMFKEMMQEMQGGPAGQVEGPAPSEGKKKKDKKKVKA